jgi:ABC-type bacteriocin/lantibiotic exporter with double-glycine peptidase domain
MADQISEKKSKKVTLASVKYAFSHIIWPRRYMLLLGLFLIIINRISGLVLPGASKYLIDEVISKNNIS